MLRSSGSSVELGAYIMQAVPWGRSLKANDDFNMDLEVNK
jgi:hypothetical protein